MRHMQPSRIGIVSSIAFCLLAMAVSIGAWYLFVGVLSSAWSAPADDAIEERLDEIEQRLDSQEDRESVIWQQVDANTETIDGMLMPTE
jgi:hypothetical protein